MNQNREKQPIRTQHLHRILTSKYLPAEQINRKFNTRELEDTFEWNSFLEVYRSLGGMQGKPQLSFRVPFLEFGRFCVLLDEAIHFNRYRSKTLRAPFYTGLSSFPLMKYRTYCRKYEVECLKAGTSKPFWTNPEAEAHFGPSQQSGDLGLSGSSGWKLLALREFMVDLIARKRKIRLLRISVWDDLMISSKLVKFNEVLMSPGTTESDKILSYVERKVIGLYADDL